MSDPPVELQVVCSRASLSASLLSRMAAAKGALERGAGRAWLCAKLNVRGARQLRAVGITSRGVLNMRPATASSLPAADASRGALAAAGRGAALAGVAADAFFVSRLVSWEELGAVALEAADGVDAPPQPPPPPGGDGSGGADATAAPLVPAVLVLRVVGMAHELRYESPLARDMFAAIREAATRAAELAKLEELLHGLMADAPPPLPPPPPPLANPPQNSGLLRDFGGRRIAVEDAAGGASPPAGATVSGLLTLLNDGWRMFGRFAGVDAAAAASPQPQQLAPALPPRRLPSRSWTAAQLLSAAETPRALAAATGAADGASGTNAAVEGGVGFSPARSASSAVLDDGTQAAAASVSGGSVAAPARLTLPDSPYAATSAEISSAAHIAALVQAALYDPRTPEGRTRGKFLAADLHAAIGETAAAQAALAAETATEVAAAAVRRTARAAHTPATPGIAPPATPEPPRTPASDAPSQQQQPQQQQSPPLPPMAAGARGCGGLLGDSASIGSGARASTSVHVI
jgi:hypothetical protein